MELKIKKEIEETVNIDLPAFFKKPNYQEYLGVINNDNVIRFSTMQYASHYSNTSLKFDLTKRDVIEANKNWLHMSEEDFLAVHEDFLRFQSLKPVRI